MVIEPRNFIIRRADTVIRVESNMRRSIRRELKHLCGVKEPITLHIVTIQSTGESLWSPYQPKGLMYKWYAGQL